MKKQLIVGLCMVALIAFTKSVFAITTDQTPSNPYNPGSVNSQVATTTKNAWATIRVIVQIAAVACVVFAGLRYMFASSDQKADIKQGLIYLAIGAVLVFGATTIIGFVADSAVQILK